MPDDHPMLTWLLRHSACLHPPLSRRVRQADPVGPCHRKKLRISSHRVRRMSPVPRHKATQGEGVVLRDLARPRHTHEVHIGTPDGVVRAWTIRGTSTQDRWSKEDQTQEEKERKSTYRSPPTVSQATCPPNKKYPRAASSASASGVPSARLLRSVTVSTPRAELLCERRRGRGRATDEVPQGRQGGLLPGGHGLQHLRSSGAGAGGSRHHVPARRTWRRSPPPQSALTCRHRAADPPEMGDRRTATRPPESITA